MCLETNSSSTLIDYIITDDYKTCILADTILKTDLFPTITVLKSVMLKSKTTKKTFFDKKTSALAFHNFNEISDWRHFYGAMTGDIMLLELQRVIERALALHAAIKVCCITKRQAKNFSSRKMGCVRKHKKHFLRNRDDETKNNLILQKEKQLLSNFMELYSKKAR